LSGQELSQTDRDKPDFTEGWLQGDNKNAVAVAFCKQVINRRRVTIGYNAPSISTFVLTLNSPENGFEKL